MRDKEKGYPPEAIREFCDKIGVSKANSEVDSGLLEYCIRENLNKNAERAMAVLNPLRVVITNYPEGKTEMLDFEINPNDETAKNKADRILRGTLYRRRGFFVKSAAEIFPSCQGRVCKA